MALRNPLRKPKPTVQPAPPKTARGASGRGHWDGFIQVDEVNQALVGEQGLRVFDEMFRTDGDCRRMIMMIVAALSAATIDVEPYGTEDEEPTEEDLKVAEFVRWNLFEHMQPDLLGHVWELLRVCLRAGRTPFEQVYGVAEWDGRPVLALDTLDLRLPVTILRYVQDGHRLTALEQQLMTGGLVTLPMRDLVFYRLGSEGDNWEGESLLRPAYKHWKFKCAIELVQAIGIERTAIGVPTGYPPTSASGEDLDAFEDFLASIKANEAAFFLAPGPRADHASTPNGTDGWFWEFVAPPRGTGGDAAIDAALNYHTGKIDSVILAEFMRLGQQGEGARATADVQQNPFLALCEGFTRLLVEAPVNKQLVPRLVGLNFDTDRYPKVTFSLIDSTSLTELGDYVQKLTAAGALRPEPTLEAHLRNLADFPEADEEAIRQKQEADQARQDEMLAQQAELRPQGAPPGGSGLGPPGGGGAPKRNAPKPAPGKPPSSPKKLQADDNDPATLARADRPLRAWEMPVSLDRIESVMDDATGAIERAAGEATRALAVALARGARRTSIDELQAAIAGTLEGLFTTGRATVVEELQRQRFADHGWMLAAADEPSEIPPAEQRTLRDRARAIAEAVRAAVTAAVAAAALQRASTDASAQSAAEAAAMGALRGQAQVHASAALNAGRAVQADAQSEEIVGSRYTSVLDGRRCASCAAADDDVLRPLDDPVRLARIPPNPGCAGGGRCRCLEAFQLRDELMA